MRALWYTVYDRTDYVGPSEDIGDYIYVCILFIFKYLIDTYGTYVLQSRPSNALRLCLFVLCLE